MYSKDLATFAALENEHAQAVTLMREQARIHRWMARQEEQCANDLQAVGNAVVRGKNERVRV